MSGCGAKHLQHMNKLLAISIAAASIAIGAIPAVAGVPQSESINEGKWQQVSDNWFIDTEDVEIKGDQLRFWVERVPTDGEEASTQWKTAWTGKIRVRCGDFHQRIDIEGVTNTGFTRIFNGKWKKIKPSQFAYELASNFCYLTKTPGYTPEPIAFTWQRKLTAEIKRQMTPEAIKRRKEKECTQTMIRMNKC